MQSVAVRVSAMLAVVSICGAFTAGAAASQSTFKDRIEQDSYAIGAQTARNLRKDNIAINFEMLLRGLRDGFGDGRLLMSDKELQAVMSHVQQEVHRNMVMNRRVEAVRNREQGSRWLAEYGRGEGVLKTPTGLQYRILKAGTGAKPLMTSVVLARYRGTLPDGTEFEGSPQDQPARLVVAQTVPGLREALLLMSVGSKWQLAMPAALAYGERGAGTLVGPNQALQFEVELADIDQGQHHP